MPRAVVWDTNVYRSQTDESALLDLEERRQVCPWADPWVIVELLAHLADPKDPDFTSCRRALRLIYVRCVQRRNGRDGGLMSDSESQIAHMITGRHLPGHQEMTKYLGELCAAVGETRESDPLPFSADDIRFVSEHVAATEAWFTTHFQEQRARVETLLAQVQNQGERRLTRKAGMRELETSGAMRNALAELLVRSAFKDVGLPVPEPLNPAFVEQVCKKLAVGFEFHAQLIRTVIYDGANLEASRTRNLMWDERISCCIGQQIGSEPIWFVSDDAAFAAAAAAAGYPKRVRSVAEYRRWLEGKRHGLRKRGK